MTITTWNIEAMIGYKPMTTFYEDFSIADKFGEAAIEDTFQRGLKTAEFMGFKALTEFVMALNWKIHEFYRRDESRAKLYNSLWKKAAEYAQETLKGDELEYYYRTTN